MGGGGEGGLMELVRGSYTEGSQVLENFTKVMILHPIAGALSLLAVIMGLVSPPTTLPHTAS